MRNGITSLLIFCLSLFLLVSCSSALVTTERLDNMDIMGKYTLNNVIWMSVYPLSNNQVSIKVTGHGCEFSDVGGLWENAVTIRGVQFTFSKRAVMVTGNGLGKCGGEYVKTTFVQGQVSYSEGGRKG